MREPRIVRHVAAGDVSRTLLELRAEVERLARERDEDARLAEDAHQRIAIHDRDRTYAVGRYETAARVARENAARAEAAEATLAALRTRIADGWLAYAIIHSGNDWLVGDTPDDVRMLGDLAPDTPVIRVRIVPEPGGEGT